MLVTTSRGSIPVRTVYKTAGFTDTSQDVGQPSEWTSMSKSDTVRRVRPADLMKGGTGRSFSRDVRLQTEVLVRENSNSLRYEPALYTHSLSDKASFQYDWVPLEAKARERIKAQNVNLAVSVAEFGRTCSMLSSLTREVVSAFRTLRSGRAFSEFVRILQRPRDKTEKSIANRWLQYQYGLRPLMQDIYGSATELSVRLNEGIFRYGTVSRERQVSGSELFTDSFSNKCAIYSNGLVKERIRYRYIIRHSSVKILASNGITNPAALVWELIPYSFVMDWIFPVGSYLSSLDALVGVEDLVVIRGGRYETSTQLFVRGIPCATLTREGFSRLAPSTTLALPRLGYQPSESLKTLANGLALLTQIRR